MKAIVSAIRKLDDKIVARPARNGLVLGILAIVTSYVYSWRLEAAQITADPTVVLMSGSFNVLAWAAALLLFLGAELACTLFLSIANRGLPGLGKYFVAKTIGLFSAGVVAYNLVSLAWLGGLSAQGYPGLALNILLSGGAALVFPVLNVALLKRTFRLSLGQAISLFVVTTALFGFLFFLASVVVGSVFYSPLAGLTGVA